MKTIGILFLTLSLVSLSACQTTRCISNDKPTTLPIVTGPIEINKYEVKKSDAQWCAIRGVILDENGEGLPFMNLSIDSTLSRTQSDIDGIFKLDHLPEGLHTLRIEQMGTVCTVSLHIEKGDQTELKVSISLYGQVELLKPIIYLYPEVKTEVEIELNYDGKVTTTYPKYPTDGWKITASPDGTLTSEDDKQYYALYWEGEPRKPLGIEDGFIVSRDQTIPFLEEKLALLGLNAKESNEFIIFWLPILEKNTFNLIHFAGNDYLEQAKLKISPTPETLIRIAMVFKGLDEEIDFPVQDLTPLIKTRSGFTFVEWGGQELPKEADAVTSRP